MWKRIIAIIFIVVGILGAVVSLLADYIGIGRYPGINYAQIIGMGCGLLMIGVGAWLVRRKKEKA